MHTQNQTARITLYEGDYDVLAEDGWECGAYESGPGWCGYPIRHPDIHPRWISVRMTPCSDDSIRDDDGYIGPSGPADSATDAVLDRIATST